MDKCCDWCWAADYSQCSNAECACHTEKVCVLCLMPIEERHEVEELNMRDRAHKQCVEKGGDK